MLDISFNTLSYFWLSGRTLSARRRQNRRKFRHSGIALCQRDGEGKARVSILNETEIQGDTFEKEGKLFGFVDREGAA